MLHPSSCSILLELNPVEMVLLLRLALHRLDGPCACLNRVWIVACAHASHERLSQVHLRTMHAWARQGRRSRTMGRSLTAGPN